MVSITANSNNNSAEYCEERDLGRGGEGADEPGKGREGGGGGEGRGRDGSGRGRGKGAVGSPSLFEQFLT